MLSLGKWIVCSAWPYVNTVPHLGTFIHLLSADVFSRYLRLKGEEVVSVTGSDEHGTPIEVEAIKKGVSPKQLTDEYHEIICSLLEKYGIRFDNYTRTENPIHIKFVQDFYRKVYENGYVFQRTVRLPYCVKCDRFLPDRFIEGICPYCAYEAARGDQCDSCGRVLDPLDLKEPKCIFCGGQPIAKDSSHWFLDLPKFSQQIKQYLDSNKQLPENALNFSYRWLEEGLKPRALTRDNKWGIPSPFPNSENKTIYVWFEAVLGYVSATIEWARRVGEPDLWREFWNDQHVKGVYFIGKDNIPFHTIIFPALLLATKEKYVLPWQVSSTEFILYEGEKFSKSRRKGVWVDEALEIADPDYWRFMLMAIRPETRDANFTWREFESHINSELNDVVGNFIHRTLTFVDTHFKGIVPEFSKFEEVDKQLIQEIERSPSRIGELMQEFEFRDALNTIVELARKGNHYLSVREPWHKVKTDLSMASKTLYLAVQLARTLAILLEPFIPFAAEEVWRQLNLPGSVHEQKWESSSELAVKVGHRINKPTPLFHKIDASRITKNRR